MTAQELLPLVKQLTRPDKLRLMQTLLYDLAQEEGVSLSIPEELLQAGQTYPVWPPPQPTMRPMCCCVYSKTRKQMAHRSRFDYTPVRRELAAASYMPLVPLQLHYAGQTVDVDGLLDSGATVNVLPYSIGENWVQCGQTNKHRCI